MINRNGNVCVWENEVPKEERVKNNCNMTFCSGKTLVKKHNQANRADCVARPLCLASCSSSHCLRQSSPA